MKIGDLVVFEFEDVYTGLVVAKSNEPDPLVDILFFDGTVVSYSMSALEDCFWEVISAHP